MEIKKQDLILVLYGGDNAEAKVSQVTGDNVFESLIRMGYNTQKLFFDVCHKALELQYHLDQAALKRLIQFG